MNNYDNYDVICFYVRLKINLILSYLFTEIVRYLYIYLTKSNISVLICTPDILKVKLINLYRLNQRLHKNEMKHCQVWLTLFQCARRWLWPRKHSPNVGTMWTHRLRHWPNIVPTLGERLGCIILLPSRSVMQNERFLPCCGGGGGTVSKAVTQH